MNWDINNDILEETNSFYFLPNLSYKDIKDLIASAQSSIANVKK
jgi:hypothetical protein